MILGIYDPQQSADKLRGKVQTAISGIELAQVWSDDAIALAWFPTNISSLDEPEQPYHSGQTISVFNGKLYNLADIQARLGGEAIPPERSGQAIGDLYERDGDEFLSEVNGKFAFALWDRRLQQLVLGRDRLGIQSLFYSTHGSQLVFSSSLKLLLKVPGIPKTLNRQAVIDYLLYCYNPSDDTFFQNIYKLPASQLLKAGDRGVQLHPYWQLSFAEVDRKSEAQYCEEIPALIEDAVQLRIDKAQPPGVLLSGGIDSSTMVSLSSQLCDRPLSTFSFRCEGKSYDESQYARLVANRFGTQHTEVPYGPENLTHIAEVTAAMDEPFCDIGIEIATFLLGQTAKGKVSYVFSGEGGDELFGGHPVYTADKAAKYIDLIPRALLQPFSTGLQKLPDSNQKKNFQVKLKRLAYSIGFPSELLSHRWRIYYRADELKDLCTDSLLPDYLSSGSSEALSERMFDTMLKHTQVEGPDVLSRCLSSDYWTLVNFYLRRLELLRPFGIENRLPLLDYRLVEYAAKIPSDLKLRGFSDTKYIYKQALRGILPHEILFDRPKLGHSVPMKNWMREQAAVKDWMVNILSSEKFKGRGLFNPDFVQRLLNEHFQKTHNHSHRLWALVVLELWFQNNLDD